LTLLGKKCMEGSYPIDAVHAPRRGLAELHDDWRRKDPQDSPSSRFQGHEHDSG
jgi:hypothetical protein